MRNLLSPYEITLLILITIERYKKERGKEITPALQFPLFASSNGS